MRYINQLHDAHKNQPIWIIGSDPTLESYPDDFVEDKISITLHLAHLKYPDATYRYANEYDRVEYLSRVDESYLERTNIFAFPFYFRKNIRQDEKVKMSRRSRKQESRKITSDRKKTYYIKYRPYPPRGIRGDVDWEFTRKKVQKVRAGKSIHYGGHGTCLHAGILSAIMLGGNPINIFASGFSTVAGKEHFGQANAIDRDMRPDIPSNDDLKLRIPMIEQTLAIIHACEQEGIKINWYSGYENGKLGHIKFSLRDIKIMKEELGDPPPSHKGLKKIILRYLYSFINSL